MKKALALILCVVLIFGIVNLAFATEYEATIMKGNDLNGNDFAKSKETLALGAAAVLLDYMLKHPKGTDWLDELDFTGTGHLVLRGSGVTLDYYYETTTKGQFLNLFGRPVAGLVVDYGVGPYNPDSKNQLYDFPMSEVLVQLQVLLEKLQN